MKHNIIISLVVVLMTTSTLPTEAASLNFQLASTNSDNSLLKNIFPARINQVDNLFFLHSKNVANGISVKGLLTLNQVNQTHNIYTATPQPKQSYIITYTNTWKPSNSDPIIRKVPEPSPILGLMLLMILVICQSQLKSKIFSIIADKIF